MLNGQEMQKTLWLSCRFYLCVSAWSILACMRKYSWVLFAAFACLTACQSPSASLGIDALIGAGQATELTMEEAMDEKMGDMVGQRQARLCRFFRHGLIAEDDVAERHGHFAGPFLDRCGRE